MEYLWNNTLAARQQHDNNTPAAGWLMAGDAGTARRGPGAGPEFKRLRDNSASCILPSALTEGGVTLTKHLQLFTHTRAPLMVIGWP